jgi:hypothetical protein
MWTLAATSARYRVRARARTCTHARARTHTHVHTHARTHTRCREHAWTTGARMRTPHASTQRSTAQCGAHCSGRETGHSRGTGTAADVRLRAAPPAPPGPPDQARTALCGSVSCTAPCPVVLCRVLPCPVVFCRLLPCPVVLCRVLPHPRVGAPGCERPEDACSLAPVCVYVSARILASGHRRSPPHPPLTLPDLTDPVPSARCTCRPPAASPSESLLLPPGRRCRRRRRRRSRQPVAGSRRRAGRPARDQMCRLRLSVSVPPLRHSAAICAVASLPRMC